MSALPSRPPDWIREKRLRLADLHEIKRVMRSRALHTVCEEARCPNRGECFSRGTATFLLLGNICTRSCGFCDIANGRPLPVDPLEPARVAAAARTMSLRYVVVTSVDRDDLRDGGAGHFAATIRALRELSPAPGIEVLTPDFRGRADVALEILCADAPDVMNHNLETVPRLYRQARPGADYGHSLRLLQSFRQRRPDVPTKSGLMLGLGETDDEVLEVMRDLRRHGVGMLTVGQYLQPRPGNLAVQRYVPPQQFEAIAAQALAMGFAHAACGPLVRSSYHADRQTLAAGV